MNEEKFVNYYVELLTNTITESIQKNLVLQTEKRVLDQTIKETNEVFKKRESELENYLKDRQNEVESLRHQLSEMRKQKDVVISETDELRKNINHLETFKNELLKERNNNENLSNELEKVRSELAIQLKNNQQLTSDLVKMKSELNSLKQQKEVQFNPVVLTDNKKKKKENTVETVEDAGNF